MYDVVIIGGGIVGLATALNLKHTNPKLKVAVLEKENKLAAHQTVITQVSFIRAFIINPGVSRLKIVLMATTP